MFGGLQWQGRPDKERKGRDTKSFNYINSIKVLQTYYSDSKLKSFEKRYRAAFINSLGGFKSVSLIGTQNKNGQTNLAIFSSLVHIGADPALMGFVVRPDTAERHTLENILETSFYTINHIHPEIDENAHQTSARFPREVSEFKAANLTEDYQENFFAPFVKESDIRLGMEFKERVDFTINGTSFIIGEIKQVYFPSACLQSDGALDLEAARTITCSGLDSYHTTNKISRLTYAKPDNWPEKF